MADDFVSDLQNLPDDVVSANAGAVETHRGTDDVTQNARPNPGNPEAATDAEPPATPTSLRDQISNALKGTPTPPAAQLDGGLVRDPATGQFVPKPTEPVIDPNAPPAAATGTVQYPQQGIPGLDAAVFATLPAETQQHVARTMETLNQQAARYQSLDQIEQVIAPRRQAWALSGMSEGQVLNQLFALSDFAEQRPGEFVRYFANQRGLDLEELAFGPEPLAPEISAANQRIQQLEAQIGSIATQQQQVAHQNTVNEIIAFAEEKGADGKTLLRPYFAELGNTVLPFIEQAIKQNPNRPRAEILTEAYNTASWANPTVRAKLLAEQTAAAEAERIRTATEAAARAKAAGVGVSTGSPGEGATKPAGTSTGSLRDDIRAAYAAAT